MELYISFVQKKKYKVTYSAKNIYMNKFLVVNILKLSREGT